MKALLTDYFLPLEFRRSFNQPPDEKNWPDVLNATSIADIYIIGVNSGPGKRLTILYIACNLWSKTKTFI